MRALVAVVAMPLLAGVLRASASAAPEAGAPSAPDAATGCALEALGAEAALLADCASCHATPHARSGSHPVGVDYASAQAAGRSTLRPLADVLQQGVRVPDGKVQCVTCHDPASPWADHLALPSGATPAAAVDLARPETYETQGGQPAPGSRVSAKPLCLACHAF